MLCACRLLRHSGGADVFRGTVGMAATCTAAQYLMACARVQFHDEAESQGAAGAAAAGVPCSACLETVQLSRLFTRSHLAAPVGPATPLLASGTCRRPPAPTARRRWCSSTRTLR